MRKALAHLKGDPVLGAIIERVGPYRIQYREPVFETLVRSIVYQQLSGKAAATIFGRLAEAVSDEMTPEAILRLSPRRMQALGLSRQKRDYIRDLARTVVASNWGLLELRPMRMSLEEIFLELTRDNATEMNS